MLCEGYTLTTLLNPIRQHGPGAIIAKRHGTNAVIPIQDTLSQSLSK
jgi:hypothetical protein